MRRLPLMLSVCTLSLGVSSCAYMNEGHIQDITIETPGASNTLCYVHADNIRYKVRPPVRTSISKSREDLVVDCMAPGNRSRKVVIKPTLSTAASWNLANGGAPGMVIDYASSALYRYPERIVVDFTGLDVKPMPLPDHNAPDVRQPETYNLEEFSAMTPMLNRDHGDYSGASAPASLTSKDQTAPAEVNSDGKGNLETVIENSDRDNLNPSTAKAAPF